MLLYISLSTNENLFAEDSPKVKVLPLKMRKALKINQAFERFHSGKATLDDRKLIAWQEKHWKTLSFSSSYLSSRQQQLKQKRHESLPYLIGKAKIRGDVYETARLSAEYYKL